MTYDHGSPPTGRRSPDDATRVRRDADATRVRPDADATRVRRGADAGTDPGLSPDAGTDAGPTADAATDAGPTAATQPLPPPDEGRMPFYAAVACGSLILALVIGIGGFLGVRSLGEDPAAPPTASGQGTADGDGSAADDSAADGGATDDGSADDGSADDGAGGDGGSAAGMPPVPIGADQVQPASTTVPYDAPEAEGWVEISFGEVTWDADEVIADANMFNDPPGEGHRYLMVTMDATYRGPGSLDAWVWVQVEYVTEDGAAHPQTRVVTPEYVSGGHGQVGEGESFTEEVVFEVPEHSPEGGRFVIGPWGTATEDGTWVEAA